MKEDGEVVTDTAGIHELVTNYYKSLFQSHAGNRYQELLEQVHQKLHQK